MTDTSRQHEIGGGPAAPEILTSGAMLVVDAEGNGRLDPKLAAFVAAARAYCVTLDAYDVKSSPDNMRLMTIKREAMRQAYRAAQQLV